MPCVSLIIGRTQSIVNTAVASGNIIYGICGIVRIQAIIILWLSERRATTTRCKIEYVVYFSISSWASWNSNRSPYTHRCAESTETLRFQKLYIFITSSHIIIVIQTHTLHSISAARGHHSTEFKTNSFDISGRSVAGSLLVCSFHTNLSFAKQFIQILTHTKMQSWKTKDQRKFKWNDNKRTRMKQY